MKISKLLTTIVFALGSKAMIFGQCEINASANPSQIYCGQSTTLTAFGKGAGTVVMDESFNNGFGSGWSGTPGATSFSNPCSPGGVDGTPHAWMDANTSVPRTLTSSPYDISGATAGVTICFDLLFAVQGAAAPCEGPDEPDEGVYFQYSTDGGATWQTIHYFNPNGGRDPQLTNWNNWCFQIPQAAITSNTQFRWHQTADSGRDYDHWGIDNVQIVQNDVNAEVAWGTPGDDHYHTYGVGSSGGQHPTPVTPTTTTTYTVEITTGTGEVCTANVTVTVLEPVYQLDIDTDPSPICEGDCGDITGTAVQVIHPGGIETFENNQTEDVSGVGLGNIGASVNVNVQGVNTSSLTSDMLTEVCINDFSYFSFGFPNSVTVADFEYKLVAPGGCGEIILIPQGTLLPSTQLGPGMQNVCFVMGGATNIGSVNEPYSGTYQPNQPFNNLVGCDPNGVWSIEITASAGFVAGVLGAFEGWSITFDNPPVHWPVDVVWDPSANMTNPNQIENQICPTGSTSYDITVSNGVPGCASHTETIPITVSPCDGCTPPVITIDPLTACAPNTLNLSDAINPSSEAATLSYHATQADAQNDANPISTTVSTSGSYWVRAEDPADPTCFVVREISVTISSQFDASFSLTNFCEGATNAASNIASPGGVFSFNPNPGDGASINSATGEISNGVGGTTYTIEYTVGSGSCAGVNTETVSVVSSPTPVISGDLGYCNGSGVTLDAGSGYTSYSWSSGEDTQIITATAQTGLTVTVTNSDGCTGTSPAVTITEGNISVTVIDSTAPDCNQSNGSIEVSASGGDGNYQFSINGEPHVSTAVFDGLPAGTHTIEVVDGSGVCSNDISINLNSATGPSITSLSSTNITCHGNNDGTVIVQAQGTAPLTYVLTDGGSFISDNATGDFTGLAPGTYTVAVTDPSNCTYTQTVTIIEPDELIVTFSSTDETCNANCNGTVNWQVQGGTLPITSTFNGNLSTENNQISLCPDNYVLIVADASGCSVTQNITVNPSDAISIDSIDVIHDGCSEGCHGSIIATSATGILYTLNGTTSNTTGVFTDLCGGVYELTVENTGGCTSTASLTVLSEEAPTANFAFNPMTPTIFDTEVVFTNHSDGASDYFWEISDITTGYFYSTSEESFTNRFPSDTARYEVCLIAYAPSGCPDTLCREVIVYDDIMIYVPNTFTPDGDEFNQSLMIYANGIDRYNFEFQIYNRWGEVIFESKDSSAGWDGTYNGKPVQDGTYVWKMSIKDPHVDFRKTLTGHINIIR